MSGFQIRLCFSVFRLYVRLFGDWVPFAQFEKRGKHPWRSLTFDKLHKWYQIVQRISYIASILESRDIFETQSIFCDEAFENCGN